MVETNRNKVQPVAPESEPAMQLGRPRPARTNQNPAEEPLVQVETRK